MVCVYLLVITLCFSHAKIVKIKDISVTSCKKDTIRGRVKSNFGSVSFFSVIFPLLPANLEKIIFVRKNPLCSPTTFQIRFNIGNKKSLPVAIFRFSGNILPQIVGNGHEPPFDRDLFCRFQPEALESVIELYAPEDHFWFYRPFASMYQPPIAHKQLPSLCPVCVVPMVDFNGSLVSISFVTHST